jgi:hypothetical protein
MNARYFSGTFFTTFISDSAPYLVYPEHVLRHFFSRRCNLASKKYVRSVVVTVCLISQIWRKCEPVSFLFAALLCWQRQRDKT